METLFTFILIIEYNRVTNIKIKTKRHKKG